MLGSLSFSYASPQLNSTHTSITSHGIRWQIEKPDFRCIWSVVDNKTKCKPVCDHGYFGLYGMKTCHQWLNCTDIKSIKGFEKIQTDTIGYVKKVRVISKTLAKLIFGINKHL